MWHQPERVGAEWMQTTHSSNNKLASLQAVRAQQAAKGPRQCLSPLQSFT